MRFKDWFSENEEYRTYDVRGEYWIDENGQVMGADGDIGDRNHESYVLESLQREIAWEFGIDDDSEYLDWDEIKSQIIEKILEEDEEDREELEKMLEDGKEDEVILSKMSDPPQQAAEKLYMADGFGDAREYAIKNWGWKRVVGNDVESWTLTPHDMQMIAQGLGDIDSTLADEAEFTVSTYSDNKWYSVTLAELEAGRLGAAQDQNLPNMQPSPQVLQQANRQREKWIDTKASQATKQTRDLDIQAMHPYYRGLTFPIGDWSLNQRL